MRMRGKAFRRVQFTAETFYLSVFQRLSPFCYLYLMKQVNQTLINNIFRPRDERSHKGTHGHSLLIAGNAGKTGAAIIAAKACLRSGTGLLTVHLPAEERLAIQACLPEAMLAFRDEEISLEGFSAIGIGPGIGISKETERLLKGVLEEAECPLVLDADALNLLAAHPRLWKYVPESTILTPHPKEFDRLFGAHENNDARLKSAIRESAARGLIIVLKGHRSVVTDGHRSFVNTTGNAGLAKGGSGDALTGILTALLAQGYPAFKAALLAVYLHGLAADLCLATQSTESMLISDVIDHLGKAFHSLTQARP